MKINAPLVLTLVLVVSLTTHPGAAEAQNHTDFGFECELWPGTTLNGTKPLLLILVNFDYSSGSISPLLRTPQDYHQLIFARTTGQKTLNGYLWANSRGLFQWSAVTPSPVQITRPESQTLNALEATGDVNFEERWMTGIVEQALTESSIDLSVYDDVVVDGVVRSNEMGVLVISNDQGSVGLTRPTFFIDRPGTDMHIRVAASNQMQWLGPDIQFNMTAHEAGHLLGGTTAIQDLYGGCSANEDVLGLSANLCMHAGSYRKGEDPTGTYTLPNDDTYLLNPWYRMKLGWSTPQLVNIASPGSATLRPPQSNVADAAVLMYDPGVPDQFWMLEYRTPISQWDDTFDQNVAGSGVALARNGAILDDRHGVVVWHFMRESNCKVRLFDWFCDNGNAVHAGIADSSPDMTAGENIPWPGGSIIPYLRIWEHQRGPGRLPVQIHVGNYAEGASSLTIQWSRERWLYVDASYTGPELGTYLEPFNTIEEAEPFANGAQVWIEGMTRPGNLLLTEPAQYVVPPSQTVTLGQ